MKKPTGKLIIAATAIPAIARLEIMKKMSALEGLPSAKEGILIQIMLPKAKIRAGMPKKTADQRMARKNAVFIS